MKTSIGMRRTLGEQIAHDRFVRCGMSMSDLAEKLGITVSELNKIEVNQAPPPGIHLWGDFFEALGYKEKDWPQQILIWNECYTVNDCLDSDLLAPLKDAQKRDVAEMLNKTKGGNMPLWW